MADLHINTEKGWNNQWSNSEDEILKTIYPQGGWEKVIEQLPHRNKSGIQQRAFKLNIKKLSYNEDYFEVIDTEEKAYWLGFLYADGYVTSQNRWGIELSIKDYNHLEKLLKALDSNMQIKTRKRTNFINETEMCGFQINNKKMFNDLLSKGVLRNKTYILKFPDEHILDKKFYSDFIRGFYDGDGSLTLSTFKSHYKDNTYTCNSVEISLVCKNIDFIEKLQEVILNETSILARIYYVKRDDIHTLRIFNKKDCLEFINYLYKDCSISLERKLIKSQELVEYCLA